MDATSARGRWMRRRRIDPRGGGDSLRVSSERHRRRHRRRRVHVSAQVRLRELPRDAGDDACGPSGGEVSLERDGVAEIGASELADEDADDEPRDAQSASGREDASESEDVLEAESKVDDASAGRDVEELSSEDEAPEGGDVEANLEGSTASRRAASSSEGGTRRRRRWRAPARRASRRCFWTTSPSVTKTPSRTSSSACARAEMLQQRGRWRQVQRPRPCRLSVPRGKRARPRGRASRVVAVARGGRTANARAATAAARDIEHAPDALAGAWPVERDRDFHTSLAHTYRSIVR